MHELKRIYKKIGVPWQINFLLSILIIGIILMVIATHLPEKMNENTAVILMNLMILVVYLFILSGFEIYLKLFIIIYKEFQNFKNKRLKTLNRWSEKSQDTNTLIDEMIGEKRVEKDFYSTLESLNERIQSYKYSEPKKFNYLKSYLKSKKNSNDRLALFNIVNAVIGGFVVKYLSNPVIIYKIVSKYDYILGMDNIKESYRTLQLNPLYIEVFSYLSVGYIVIRIVYITYNFFNNFKISLILEIMDNTKDIVSFNRRNVYFKRRIKRTKKRFK